MTRRVLSSGREHTGDRQMEQIWRQLDAVAHIVSGHPFINGRLITEEDRAVAGSGLAFVSGVARSIAHKLGRRARGFLEIYAADVPSAGHVGLYPTAHPTGASSATHVTVTPAATGACFLWVF